MILSRHELEEYKELEDIIKKCFLNIQAANLSFLNAKIVLKYLDRLIDENSFIKTDTVSREDLEAVAYEKFVSGVKQAVTF